jgi:hypothetical protein
MTTFITGLKVCIDCGDVIANGWSNFNENYPEGYSETNAKREDIERGLSEGYWIVDSDGDTDFSSKPCALCRSTFGGSRYNAAMEAY